MIVGKTVFTCPHCLAFQTKVEKGEEPDGQGGIKFHYYKDLNWMHEGQRHLKEAHPNRKGHKDWIAEHCGGA